jgi:hypothetical protein
VPSAVVVILDELVGTSDLCTGPGVNAAAKAVACWWSVAGRCRSLAYTEPPPVAGADSSEASDGISRGLGSRSRIAAPFCVRPTRNVHKGKEYEERRWKDVHVR